jgi:hypothetical protein
MHRDLTLYVDDSAIFSVSKTTTTATASAVQGFKQTLDWLTRNGLVADPTKTELMIFTPHRSNPELTRGHIHGVTYGDNQRITTSTTSLQYLGVHIMPKLE